jgi:hypothetical protein
MQDLKDITFSSSSIKNFLSCPRKFLLSKSDLKLDSVGSQLLLGSAVHSTAEAVCERRAQTEQQIVMFFEDEYKNGYREYKSKGISVQYSRYNNYKKDLLEGAGMSLGFAKHILPIFRVLSVEASLTVSIQLLTGMFPLECHIDMIVEEDDGVGIYDIKTGRSSPTGVYLDNDIQLGGYAYAYLNGRYIITKRGAKGPKQYTYIDKPFETTKPLKYIGIINLRALIDGKGAVIDNYNGGAIYRHEFKDDTAFLNNIKYINDSMQLCQKNNYWPKNVSSCHDSPCLFCSYYSECEKQK